jgi:hypothetical protein
VVSLFERLDKGRPPPVEEVVKQPGRDSPPIEKLLDWLVNHWTKPTISAREIRHRGPNSIRDRQRVIDLAEILVRQGRLIPIPTRRRDMKAWQIVRRPGGEG